jgi:hypothetical protein
LAQYAPLASPALTGTPTAPTAAAATNTTQIATTAYVMAKPASAITAIPVPIAQGGTNATALPMNAVGTMGLLNNLLTTTGSAAQSLNTATGVIGNWGDSSVVCVGAGRAGYVELMRLNGTFGAPTTLNAGDNIGILGYDGWGGTAWNSAARAVYLCQAAETWTGTTQGTRFVWNTTTVGTTTTATRMTLNQGLVIGNTAPDPGQGGLVLNASSAAPPMLGSDALVISGADGGGVTQRMYGWGGYGPAFVMYAAGGTNNASKTAVASATWLGELYFGGWDGTTYVTGAYIVGMTSENWSSTAHGTRLTFSTTPIGSTTNATAMTLYGSGGVSIGSVNSDPGGGGLRVPNGGWVSSVNAAGTGSVNMVAVDSSNNLALGYGAASVQMGGVNNALLYLQGAASNLIYYNANGIGPPAFTTRSLGTKIVFFPNVSPNSVDYAIGMDGGTMWHSISQNITTNYFRWYGGTTMVAQLDGAGSFTVTGSNSSFGWSARDNSSQSWLLYSTTWSGIANTIRFYNGQDRFVIRSDGHVGPAVDNTYWNGWGGNAWYAVQSYSFPASSDPALKRDIRPLSHALDTVEKLAPVEFRWKQSPDGGRRHTGFLAPEVRDVLGADHGAWAPPLDGDKSAATAVCYNELTAVLWKAVQELSAEVKELKARLH